MAPLTWCGLPPALVGSQLPDATQMKWPSAGSGTEASHAQSHTMIDEDCPSCSISRPSSRRQATVESQSLPEICSPVPDVNSGVLLENCDEFQESRGVGTRGCASSRPDSWQRGGPRNQRRKRANHLCRSPHGWFLDTDTSRRAIWSISGCVEMEGWKAVLGKFLKYVKKHAFPLVGNVKVHDAPHAYANDCFVLEF